MDKHTVLKQYFGDTDFRPGQEALVDALLSGRDVLGVMPMGAGKSLCYQIPALLLPGITLVISPLISLMKDRVSSLIQMGIPAAYLNAALSPKQFQLALSRAAQGSYRLIYVSPKYLNTEDFLLFARAAQISLVAVEEAHRISQWGQKWGFSPSYLEIADFLRALPDRPPVGAFTATGTPRIREDILRILELRDPLICAAGFDRPNLSFEVIHCTDKTAVLQSLLAERRGKSGIIYCNSHKSVKSTCETLLRDGYSATLYHAGLTAGECSRNQEDFICGRSDIMVATNAFRIGINKSNVSFVIHYNMPIDLASYYQEASQAGQDGTSADCILLFSKNDIAAARGLIRQSSQNKDLTEEDRAHVLESSRVRLQHMIEYCWTSGCLRARLLSYFGEQADEQCGNCGNCRTQHARRDVTQEAQKILSCVARVEKLYPFGIGISLYVRVLRGAANQSILDLGLDSLPTYGLLSELSQEELRTRIDQLIADGYLRLDERLSTVLRLTERSSEVLFHGARVEILADASAT